EMVSICLDYFKLRDCIKSCGELDANHSLWRSAVLDSKQCAPMEIETVNSVERNVLWMTQPLDLLGANVDDANTTRVVRHEDVLSIRMHGRRLWRNKLVTQFF